MKALVLWVPPALAAFASVYSGARWQETFMVFLAGACACQLLVTGWEELWQERDKLAEQLQRMLDTWREIVEENPLERWLRKCGLAVVMVWFAVFVARGLPTAAPLLWVSIVVLALGAGLAFGIRAGRVLALAWNPVVGKVLSLTAGAALISVSLACAKDITHALTHVDAKHLPDFTNLLAAIVLPWLCMVVATALLGVYAVWLGCKLIVVSVVTEIRRPIKAVVDMFRQRRAARGAANPPDAMSRGRDDLLIRFVTAGVLLGGLAMVGEELGKLPARLAPQLRMLAVSMEYRTGSTCVGLEKLPVAYLYNAQVSVARRAGDTYRFAEEPCVIKPAPPNPAE